MKYDVDYDFAFEIDADGFPFLPDNLTKDENGFYVLPNGKYLPIGFYHYKDGRNLIYEPIGLSPSAEMLKNFK